MTVVAADFNNVYPDPSETPQTLMPKAEAGNKMRIAYAGTMHPLSNRCEGRIANFCLVQARNIEFNKRCVAAVLVSFVWLLLIYDFRPHESKSFLSL